ncbi:MAG: hypothetical protein LIO75_01010 [Lachnospiraceae bacterium]|nr:hypothetical protein [Lachnospiraceae bacterium]
MKNRAVSKKYPIRVIAAAAVVIAVLAVLFSAYRRQIYLSRDINILWVGTSIPAGDAGGDYPSMVGELLGDHVQVYNISLSCGTARCGAYEYVSEEDPLGMAGFSHFPRYLLSCLSLSRAEKEELLSEINTSDSLFSVDESYLTERRLSTYYNFTWDGEMKTYLTDYDIDYVVYDMGYNDTDVLDYENSEELLTVTDDRSSYIGASEFIFEKIAEYSPDTEIIIAGHYARDDKPYLWQAQELLAEDTGVAIYKTWEYTGWTDELITAGGSWQDGYWVEDETITDQITVLERWLPDGTHPGYDRSGEANRYLAQIHAELLRGIIY